MPQPASWQAGNTFLPYHVPLTSGPLTPSPCYTVTKSYLFRRTRGVLFRWTDESRKVCVNVDQEEAKERMRERKERGREMEHR